MLFRNQFSPARKSLRQWWNSSVDSFTASAHVKAIGLNISGGGMGLFAVTNLPVGAQIEVEFRSPASGLRTRIPGTVRHRALYLYGIEFLCRAEMHPNSGEVAAEF